MLAALPPVLSRRYCRNRLPPSEPQLLSRSPQVWQPAPLPAPLVVRLAAVQDLPLSWELSGNRYTARSAAQQNHAMPLALAATAADGQWDDWESAEITHARAVAGLQKRVGGTARWRRRRA